MPNARARLRVGLVTTLIAVSGALPPAMLAAPQAAFDDGADLGTTVLADVPWHVDAPVLDFYAIGILGSETREVVLFNDGTDPLPVTAFDVTAGTPEQAAAFSVAETTCLAAPVAVGSSCTILVRFAPTEMIDYAAVLRMDVALPVPVEDAAIVDLLGTGSDYAVPVTWAPHVVASPSATWNTGRDLARTSTSSGERLHLLSLATRVNGKWVKDSGPYQGVLYQRSSTGSAWTTAKRLNTTKVHGYWASVAATGDEVHAVWAQSAKIYKMTATTPRVLYYRRNLDSGASNGWKSAVRLTSAKGRIDLPSVAASGKRVLIAWTDGETGSVKVARSTDHGKTFRTSTVGTTSRKTTFGRAGKAKIAISGSLAIVAWASNGSGAIKARISRDGGATWGASTVVTQASTTGYDVAALGGRAVVAYVGDVVTTRLWNGAWEAGVREPGALTSAITYGPTVALHGASEIAVAWSACLEGCDVFAEDTRIDLHWAESPDNGEHWGIAPVAQSQETDDTSASDMPSITWGTKRVASWNASEPSTGYYRIHVAVEEDVPAAKLVALPLVAVPGVPAARVDDEVAAITGRVGRR